MRREVHSVPTHSHDATPAKPLPGPSPVWVQVADTQISEADIAREMQHHRADDPHQARFDAARALVVRELLRLEIARQRLDEQVEPVAGETLEEASIRLLLEREAPVPTPDAADCRRYFEHNHARLHRPDRIRVRHILLAAQRLPAASGSQPGSP